MSPPPARRTRRTEDLVHRLRDDVAAGRDRRTPAPVHVGGATAAVGRRERLHGRPPAVFIGAVIALSFLLLLFVFRSVLVALKAAVMNVLAIGAAYGVMAVALAGRLARAS